MKRFIPEIFPLFTSFKEQQDKLYQEQKIAFYDHLKNLELIKQLADPSVGLSVKKNHAEKLLLIVHQWLQMNLNFRMENPVKQGGKVKQEARYKIDRYIRYYGKNKHKTSIAITLDKEKNIPKVEYEYVVLVGQKNQFLDKKSKAITDFHIVVEQFEKQTFEIFENPLSR